jgi:carbonic anhydrase/acetyltransferase-like protein (isoleucine patch superfamily)
VSEAAHIIGDVEIGNRCIIAACTLVRQGMKIPDNSFVVGIPGKFTGPPTKDQLWSVEGGVKDYEELMKQYKKDRCKV